MAERKKLRKDRNTKPKAECLDSKGLTSLRHYIRKATGTLEALLGHWNSTVVRLASK